MNILHIEKSNSVKTMVAKTAAQRGHLIDAASDLETSLKILEKKNIDLILSCYANSAAETGAGCVCMETLENISMSDFGNIPVIVMADELNHETEEKLYKLGVSDFISRSLVSTEGFSRYIDLYLRDDRMISQLRELDIAVFDEKGDVSSKLGKIFKLKQIENADFVDDSLKFFENDKKYAIYIINLDNSMLNAEELITPVREKSRKSMIIAAVETARDGEFDSMISAGADDVVFTPFKTGIMLSKLKSNARIYNKINCSQ